MNILIVDDDIKKINSITNDFLRQDKSNKVAYAINHIQATNLIMDRKDELDLIILDWTFPVTSNGNPKFGMGKKVIDIMKIADINIDTIICSPDYVDVDQEKYPFVKGSIQYVEILDVGVMAYTMLGKPINLNYDSPEEIKTLKRVKEDTGYKRHKSSQPWWMK